VYQQAFELSPNSQTVSTLFRARTVNSEVPKALALMEQWLVDNPEDLAPRQLYARLLMRERQWEKARDAYEALRDKGVTDSYALNNLAIAYQHLGDKRALEAAQLAWERSPQNARIIDTYGWILAQNGDAKKGLRLLRQAYSRLSSEPAIRYHIGLALLRIAGRDSEAREELKAALVAQGATPAPWVEAARKTLNAIGKAN
jgi:Tfp pilus assembly protein PilF